MEGREFGRQDVGLRVEHVFGPVVHVQVPYLDQPVWVVGRGWVFSVGCQDEFRELGFYTVNTWS